MKSFLLHLVVTFSCCFTLNAQNIITVNNTPGTVADYTSVNDAIKAAKNGDYIYVQHSNTRYGEVFIDKQVHIKGRSHSLKDYRTSIENVKFIRGSSGSSIESCAISFLTIDTHNGSLSNIDIINNKIFTLSGEDHQDFFAKNITFKGNVIISNGDSSNIGTNFVNVTFSNNLVMQQIGFRNSEGLKIHNNIFINIFSWKAMLKHGGNDKITISDCIYICNSEKDEIEQANNVIYKNCIAYNYNTSHTYKFDFSENTDVVDCKDNTDPKFVKYNGNGFNPDEDDVRRQPNAALPNAGVFGDL